MKKVLTGGMAAILLLSVLLAMMPVAQGATKDGFVYDVKRKQATITGYRGKETELVIPSELGGVPVTAIAASAFVKASGLRRVQLSDGVLKIGSSAFKGLAELESVHLPAGLRSIEKKAFADCELLKVVRVPRTVTDIHATAFENCPALSFEGFAGSKAEDLARRRKIPFVQLEPTATVMLFFEDVPFEGEILGIDLNAEDRTLSLSALTEPENPWAGVEWASSRPAVATVDKDGLVTGLKKGRSTITATAKDGSRKSASVNINVSTLVALVSISGPKEASAGQQVKLSANVFPEEADARGLVWTSSDEQVARVNRQGTVTVRAVDERKTVMITATAGDGSGVSDTLPLAVYPAATAVLMLLGDEPVFERELPQIDLTTGRNSFQLDAKVEPAVARQEVTWRSSAPHIVSVDEYGLLTAVKTGRATITATAADGSRKAVAREIKVVRLPGPTPVPTPVPPLSLTITGVSSEHSSVPRSSGTVYTTKTSFTFNLIGGYPPYAIKASMPGVTSHVQGGNRGSIEMVTYEPLQGTPFTLVLKVTDQRGSVVVDQVDSVF